MQVRWSNLHWFFDRFFNAFSCKKWLKPIQTRMYEKVSKFHRFLVVLGTQNRQKGTKKGDFFQACWPKGCLKASRDASGTNFDAPGRSFWVPWRAFWDSLGSFWGHSEVLGRLFGQSWTHVGRQTAASRSKQQKTAANSNRNQQQIAANGSNC